MKKRNNITLWMALGLLAAFALWTAAISVIDVQPVGPNGSEVGFAAANVAFHDATGVHMALYNITDWLGLVPVFLGMGFAVLGLVQLIGRKSLLKVDRSILALGGFYLIVFGAYLFFETVVINYRPVLIEGYLEASYPSSTTLLVLCMMPTAKMQLDGRIKNPAVRKIVGLAIVAFTVFMVVGRLVSGVHWITDIAGGVLLSAGLVMLYRWACEPYLK
jgi:undecaprenyl-diphosphatase